jgi:hypothetical protein
MAIRWPITPLGCITLLWIRSKSLASIPNLRRPCFKSHHCSGNVTYTSFHQRPMILMRCTLSGPSPNTEVEKRISPGPPCMQMCSTVTPTPWAAMAMACSRIKTPLLGSRSVGHQWVLKRTCIGLRSTNQQGKICSIATEGI